MSKNLSPKSVNNRAHRRRHLQRKPETTALHGSLVDFQPSKQDRTGLTVALFIVALVAAAAAVMLIGRQV